MDKLGEVDQRIIIETLKILFPKRGELHELSIRHKDNFHRYFGNVLFDSDLSERDFNELLLADSAKKGEMVDSLIAEGKGDDLKVKVRNFDRYKSKEQFKNLIEVWVILFNKNLDDSAEIFILRLRERKSIDFFEIGEYKSFISQLFDLTQVIHFENTFVLREIIRHYIQDSKFEFELSKEEAQALALKSLVDYANGCTEIDERAFRLFYNCYQDIDKSTSRVILMPEANKVILEKIKEKPKSFLKFIIRPQFRPHDGETYVFEPFIPRYFGSYEKFEEFLKDLSKTEPDAKIIIKFFTDFSKNNFQSFTTKETIKWLRIDENGNATFVE